MMLCKKALKIIDRSKMIHIYANSHSRLIARKFQLQMMRIQHFVDVQDMDLIYSVAMVNSQDCMIIISYSGGTNRLIDMANFAKRNHTLVIAITSLGDNQLSKIADCVLHISTREKMYSKIASFTSEYSVELILNIIYANIFAKNYDENMAKVVSLGNMIEHRQTGSNIIKEKNGNIFQKDL